MEDAPICQLIWNDVTAGVGVIDETMSFGLNVIGLD